MFQSRTVWIDSKQVGQKYVAQTLLSVPAFITTPIRHRQGPILAPLLRGNGQKSACATQNQIVVHTKCLDGYRLLGPGAHCSAANENEAARL